MEPYIKIQGDYRQVCNFLAQPDFYRATDEDTYWKQKLVDLNRTKFYSIKRYISELQAMLMKKPAINPAGWVYAQGGNDGRVFAEHLIKANPLYNMGIVQAEEEGTKAGFYNHVALAYVNDEDVPCALAICYLRDDSNLAVPPDERPLQMALTVIENTLANDLTDRKVTCYVHQNLYTAYREIWPDAQAGEAVCEADQINQEVPGLLKSADLHAFIDGFIQHNTLNRKKLSQMERYFSFPFKKFESFLERLCLNSPNNPALQTFCKEMFAASKKWDCNPNLELHLDRVYKKIRELVRDPRASKKNMFIWTALKLELLISSGRFEFSVDEQINLNTLIEHLQNAQLDAYFAAHIREEAESKLEECCQLYIHNVWMLESIPSPQPPALLRQGFLRRNLGALFVGSTATMLAAGTAVAAVILSVMLAPIFASTLGAAFVFAAVCSLAGLKLWLNSRHLKQEQTKFEKQTQDHDTLLLNHCHAFLEATADKTRLIRDLLSVPADNRLQPREENPAASEQEEIRIERQEDILLQTEMRESRAATPAVFS